MMKPWQHRFENHMRDAELMMAESAWRDAFPHFKSALGEVPEPLYDHYEATRAVMGSRIATTSWASTNKPNNRFATCCSCPTLQPTRTFDCGGARCYIILETAKRRQSNGPAPTSMADAKCLTAKQTAKKQWKP
ncbi:hypothetical protein Pla8534_43090 [Lignipirellula cremea]|uniref:Uncharacterized protein n=1 Tax=Lignipirellula cremea TaxID=2528010 RepID=A0A518DXC1_9BACT|nr:hypothetical protein Pla8534_43090 [Lignipirellula cremea]